jgi:hypothetical protein
MAIQATRAKMAAPDHRAHLDQTDLPDHLARMERKDQPETQRQAFQLHPVMLAQLAKMDHQDQPVKTAPQDPTAAPAPLDPKDPRARPDLLATTVHQAKKAHLVPMDPKENPVFAPNIAPPMVVSSSRMEQGDKLQLKPSTPLLQFASSFDIGIHLPRFNNFYPSIVMLLASMSFERSKQQPS